MNHYRLRVTAEEECEILVGSDADGSVRILSKADDTVEVDLSSLVLRKNHR